MYIEYVLTENLILNFFIVSLSQKILKDKSRLSFLGIIISSLIALLCPLFNLNLLSKIIVRFATLVFLTCFCFTFKNFKQNLLAGSILLLATLVFGGGCAFVSQLLGFSTYLLILTSSFCVFTVLRVIISILAKKKIVHTFSTDVVIKDGEKKVCEKGYIDSGNLLYDPITSKPICLITYDIFQKLYSGNLITLFANKYDLKKLKNGHYISVNSAVKGGKILVFDVDEMDVLIEDKTFVYKNISLGLSFSGFEKAMHSKVLLHSSQGCL